MTSKHELLLILQDIEERVTQSPQDLDKGICDLIPLTPLSLFEQFEIEVSKVLGFDVSNHFYWVLPLGEDGEYVTPHLTTDGLRVHPTTGKSCVDFYLCKPKTLRPARLKIIRDCITHLEGELNLNSKGNENDTEK